MPYHRTPLRQFSPIIVAFLFCFALLPSCSKQDAGNNVVGIDPSWRPLDIGKNAVNVYGFTIEAINTIERAEHLTLPIITTAPAFLEKGLKQGRYTAILSAMLINQVVKDQYDYSLPLLLVGPVLVVPHNAPISKLREMAGKKVATITESNSFTLLEKHPHILINLYSTITDALAQVANGKVDGALIPALTAYDYCNNIYHGVLKVATPPLSQQGIRLFALKDQNKQLIDSFDNAIRSLQKKGTFDTLMAKWGIAYLPSPPKKPLPEEKESRPSSAPPPRCNITPALHKNHP
ncbi:transporter substrate-binding domain-containing protein [Simkania negevensis]|uniref:Transporter substrate-binding domain-containing protein n=1 Tax=Simkania negevensis TaxID=83561 RepID=A0ABS3APD4_9BACT|nr:transporter substrate-binding domain-containing protein [Simkania negevensis]